MDHMIWYDYPDKDLLKLLSKESLKNEQLGLELRIIRYVIHFQKNRIYNSCTF